ncbi:MAG: hypothetical protein WAW10_14470 [Gallionella sp.]
MALATRIALLMLLALVTAPLAGAATPAEEAAWDGEWNLCKDRLTDVLDSIDFEGTGNVVRRTPATSKPPSKFGETFRKPGKFIGAVDNLAIDPIVTFFTTEDDNKTPGNEALTALLFKVLEGGLKLYFPAYGITLDAGKVIVGNSIVAVSELYESGHRASIERMVFGGSAPNDAFLLGNVDDLFKQQSFFGEFLPRHKITTDNIARKIKSEQALRDLWFKTYRSYLMSGVGSIGPLQKPDEFGRLPVDNRLRDGWDRLLKYWELKRASEFGESLRANFVQQFRAPCLNIAQKTCPAPFSEPIKLAGQQRVECMCQQGYVWNHDRSKCLLEPAAQVKAKYCEPGMQAYWNMEAEEVQCQCKPAHVWNNSHTRCILEPAAQIQALRCEPSAEAYWDKEQELALCRCQTGSVWKRDRTACIRSPEAQVAAAKCHPNAQAYWNNEREAVGCRCIQGYAWNDDKAACLPEQQARLEALRCPDFYPNSRPIWDEKQNRGVCSCKEGYRWNEKRDACIANPERLVALSKCSEKYPSSEAYWNSQEQKVNCRCKKGTRWIKEKGACLAEQRDPGLGKPSGEVAAGTGRGEGANIMEALVHGLATAVAQSQGVPVPGVTPSQTHTAPAPSANPPRRPEAADAPAASRDDWFIIIASALSASNENYRKHPECQYKLAHGMRYVSGIAGGKREVQASADALRAKGYAGVEVRYFGDIGGSEVMRIVGQWKETERRGYNACYDATRRKGGGRPS